MIRNEKLKLERLIRAKAPVTSTSWVKRQINYLESGHPIHPTLLLTVTVATDTPKYVHHNVHDMCVAMERELFQQSSLPRTIHIRVNPWKPDQLLVIQVVGQETLFGPVKFTDPRGMLRIRKIFDPGGI